ncbi:MAG: hypothetical protein PHI18_08365 [bacterium]|nr:hypothetical protein [bacterium]
MNWTLILLVSLISILIGLVSLFGLMDVNPWIVGAFTCVISALILGRFSRRKYFMHGFWAGVIGSLVSTMLMYLFWDTYLASNPAIADKLAQMPQGMDARTMTLISSIFGAAISGVVMGLLAWLAGRIFGEPEAAEEAAATGEKQDNPPTQG